MLATRRDPATGLRIVENSERLALLRHQQPTKRPDLLLARGDDSVAVTLDGAEAVLDAKYKVRVPESPSSMDMGDQYQQFAYAATTGKRTVFIFAAPPSTPVRLSAWQEVNVPLSKVDVAVATVPFPDPHSSWESQLATSLAVLMPQLAARSSAATHER
jgi:hypothetical protein